jgi:hypothetical protein
MGFYTINSFNAGEISKKLFGRVDIAQYARGCSKLENFIVTPFGSIERRPGMIYCADLSSADVRILPFVFNNEQTYICVFTPLALDIYTPNGQAYSQVGETLSTEYTANELSELQYVQSGDIMTIVHGNHPVMELQRKIDQDDDFYFEFTRKTFEFPPTDKFNTDSNIKLNFQKLANSENYSFVWPSGVDFPWQGNLAGNYFVTEHHKSSNNLEVTFRTERNTPRKEETYVDETGYAVSESILIAGNYQLTTRGTWSGILELQRAEYDANRDDDNSWSTVFQLTSEKDNNASTSGTEDDKAYYRLKITGYEQSDSGTIKACKCFLSNPDFKAINVWEIQGANYQQYNNSPVTVTVDLKPVQPVVFCNASADWAMGAWNQQYGYPKSIAFYQERMAFGGNKHSPNRLWLSKTGDWDNFYPDADKADSALDFTLASDTVNEIRWLCSHQSLIIGTADSEWSLSGDVLSSSDFQLLRQSVYGTAKIPGVMVGNSLIFLQADRSKVREFIYSQELESYQAADLSILAGHILQGGVKSMQLVRSPLVTLFCLLDDGTLSALTYEREQQVFAWAKHTTDGEILDIAVLPDSQDRQILFLAVRRGKFVTLEKLELFRNDVFSDCAKVIAYTDGKFGSMELPEVLQGRCIQLVTGEGVANDIDSAGNIVSFGTSNFAAAGLPYISTLHTLPLESAGDDGQTLLRKKTACSIRLRCYDSIGGEVACNDQKFYPIHSFDLLRSKMDEAAPAADFTAKLPVLSGFEEQIIVKVRQTQALPLNIAYLTVKFDVVE